jgi:hypothetical protein
MEGVDAGPVLELHQAGEQSFGEGERDGAGEGEVVLEEEASHQEASDGPHANLSYK